MQGAGVRLVDVGHITPTHVASHNLYRQGRKLGGCKDHTGRKCGFALLPRVFGPRFVVSKQVELRSKDVIVQQAIAIDNKLGMDCRGSDTGPSQAVYQSSSRKA